LRKITKEKEDIFEETPWEYINEKKNQLSRYLDKLNKLREILQSTKK